MATDDPDQTDRIDTGDVPGEPSDGAVRQDAPREDSHADTAPAESAAAADAGRAADAPDLAPGDADGQAVAADEEPSAPMTVDALMAGPPVRDVSDQLVAIVEAVVFASPEPITLKAMLKLLDSEPKEDVLAAVEALKRRYDERPGGLQVVEVAGGYQIVTRSELNDWVRRMFHERTTQKLSVQALETLAVIAYKQPITAAEITDIRGVNTSGVIGTLLERGLVKISGRKQVVGRPFLYSTTREFLDRFGLRDLADLPKVQDMADALGVDVPIGLAVEAPPAPAIADEPATTEDAAILAGAPTEDETTEDETTETLHPQGRDEGS